MANCYFQIRCGNETKIMTIGREYDFSVGEKDSKISSIDLLDFLEETCLKAIEQKYGPLYELQ